MAISNDVLDTLDEEVDKCQSKLLQIKVFIGLGTSLVAIGVAVMLIGIIIGSLDLAIILPTFTIPCGLLLIYYNVFHIGSSSYSYNSDFPNLKTAEKELKKAEKARTEYILKNG